MTRLAKRVTFLLPCLNEEKTLPQVIGEIQQARALLKGWWSEILVSDNGSTDGSVRIARRLGARVAHCRQRGYGAALGFGVRQARGDIVVFADADASYDFREAPALLEQVLKGNDLVVGTRLNAKLRKGAMPWMHRWVGTPVLTGLINFLYGRPGARLSDCNSGFRAFPKRSFLAWGVGSPGMEFASEMLVKAVRAGSRVAEVEITLRPDARDRLPHLQRWKDGMRHLLQILMEAPWFFRDLSLLLFSMGWAILLAGWYLGPLPLGRVWILGLHTMMLAMLLTCFAMTIWSAGLFLCALGGGSGGRAYRFVLDLREDRLFWSAAGGLAAAACLMVPIALRWAANGYANLGFEKETLLLVAFSADILIFIWNVFVAHLIKKLPKGAA